MESKPEVSKICGVWVDAKKTVAHLSIDSGEGPRIERALPFRPFVWAMADGDYDFQADDHVEELSGDGEYDRLVDFPTVDRYREFLKTNGKGGWIDWIRSLEQQFLLSQKNKLFGALPFSELRRMQLDIETASSEEGSFPDAARESDRVLAIGLRCGERIELLTLEERSDAGEKALLLRLNACIQEIDPDTIEGHNIFKFDLNYLKTRAKRLRVPCAWGRFGQKASFRNSRLRVAERWIDFTRCDLPGRAVIDTYLLIQIYDITTREMMSYGLKDVAKYLGLTPEDGGDRTYIAGDQIQYMFDDDRARFLAYLADDLRETEGVANRLLPTYFEQVKVFPTTLQDSYLRGTASKVDLVFQEEYYHRKAACPIPGETSSFAGGYTASFEEGVYGNVLHFDVASLYPSILLLIGRNPKRDTQGVFIPMLKRLREYRLEFKRLAKETGDEVLASEYMARQTSFKILINSFYGYLGFSGARFGDGALAAEVTARGREILQQLVEFFKGADCPPLEADTDGIYIATDEFFGDPEALLAKAQAILPDGIELEYDGKYVSMFCYKAKNYALYDGEKVTIRGSALRSRGIEPFLKNLTMHLVKYLLGAGESDPAVLAREVEDAIDSSSIEIDKIAKSEILSQNPDAYRKKIEAGGKPRRASLEVALKLKETPRMGERVSYYIGPKAKGQTSDWQRAQPIGCYDPINQPYDPSYYTKKLADWRKRYAPFLPALIDDSDQGTLF